MLSHVQPHRAAWRWRRPAADERNDYFMFGTPDSLAVGGGDHFAIFLVSVSIELEANHLSGILLTD